MEHFAQNPAAHSGGESGTTNGTALVRLLEERLDACRKLEESLKSCRVHYIQSDLDRVLQSIQIQSYCCERIAAAEAALNAHGERFSSLNIPGTPGQEPGESQRARRILEETATLRASISRLSRTHARIIARLAYTNGILNNLYANALVYGDPRMGAGQPRRWLEK
jgi:hypothetical protein